MEAEAQRIDERAGRPRLAGWLLAGGIAAVGWGLFALWHPSGDLDASLCLFRRATTVPCPGCGMTRAFTHLARGDLAAAWQLHPLAPILALEGLALWLAWGALAVTGRPRPALAWTRWLALAHLVALVALWVARFATGTLPQ